MMNKTINLNPVSVEEITPRRYLEIYQSSPEDIEGVEIAPAPLGSGGFGRIIVRYKTPIYKQIVAPRRIKRKRAVSKKRLIDTLRGR